MAIEFEETRDEHISREDFILSPKEEKQRKKEEKRRRRQYKFSDKKHPAIAIVSSSLALAALIFLIGAIIISAAAKGSGGTVVGSLGALSFFAALAAVVTGLCTFRKTDVKYRFAWTGIFAGGIIWLCVAAIIVVGI